MSKLFKRNFVFCIAFLLAAGAPASPQNQNSVDVPALLAEAKQKTAESWRTMIAEHANYTYKWRKVWRGAGKPGETIEKSELYEIFVPKNCRALKKCRYAVVLLATDGKWLAPEKIEKQRIKAGRELAKTERKAESLPAASVVAPPNWLRFAYFISAASSNERKTIIEINGQEILEKCDFAQPVLETVNGRETIALSFRPRPSETFGEATKYMPGVEGKIWVDRADKVFVRLAMWETGKQFENQTSDSLLENAALAFNTTRTKEGFLVFPSGTHQRFENPNLFHDMKVDFSLENFDHHFFAAEIKAVEINNPAENKR